MKKNLSAWTLSFLFGCILLNVAAVDPKKEETKVAPVPAKQPKPVEPGVRQKQTLGFFHSVYFYSIGNLYITKADESDLTVEAGNAILPLVNATVKGQILYIDLKDADQHSQAKIDYYLKVKTLQAINIYSSSTLYIKDGFETKVLSIGLLGGFGEAHLNIDVTKLTTKIAGAGKIDIEGIADDHRLSINGLGEFDGSKLKSKITTVSLSGSGIAKVNASDELDIKISGDGIVKYCGKPNIVKQISGKGKIDPLSSGECR